MATLSGGDRLKNELERISTAVNGAGLLKVGFLSGATYPARSRSGLRAQYNKRRAKGIQSPVKGASSGTVNVATVATWNEFGTGTAPPRPFFRNMIRKKSHEWGPALVRLLKATNWKVQNSLAMLGEGIAGQLKESIIDTNSPPNKPSTIAAKGHSKVLVDTAHMLMSVDSEVV